MLPSQNLSPGELSNTTLSKIAVISFFGSNRSYDWLIQSSRQSSKTSQTPTYISCQQNVIKCFKKTHHFFICMDEFCCVLHYYSDIETLSFIALQKSKICYCNYVLHELHRTFLINTSIKCKPVDSLTRQEVKADEQKTNNVTEQMNEYVKHTRRVCFTYTCSLEACHILSYNYKSLILTMI